MRLQELLFVWYVYTLCTRLIAADAFEAYGADLVRQSLLKWNEACIAVTADYKPEARVGSVELAHLRLD